MIKPRKYQTECIEAIEQEFDTVDSTLVVEATGLGKTVQFAMFADRFNGIKYGLGNRVLVVAERREIVEQNARTIAEVTGMPVGIEMADSYSQAYGKRPRIVVGTIQTLQRQIRAKALGPEGFGLLVFDEAHHALANWYGDLRKIFGRHKLLGATATPEGSGKKNLSRIFESVAFQYDIEDGINDGWLTPINQQIVEIKDLYLDEVRTVRGDLDRRQLAALMEHEEQVQGLALGLFKNVGQRATLVFTASVAQAHHLAEVMNRSVADCAIAMDAKTPKGYRREQLERFNRGEFQFLINYGLFLEGWDCTRVAAVGMGRPTKSRALYKQSIGRGTRLHFLNGHDRCDVGMTCPTCAGKDDLLVLDFVGQSTRHKLVTAANILAPDNADDRLIERAAAYAAKEPIEVRMALAKAQEELDAELKEKRRRLFMEGVFENIEVDPFSDPEMFEIKSRYVRMASDKQKDMLITRLKYNPNTVERMTHDQAQKAIRRFFAKISRK